MAHGWSSVKEMSLASYAEAFAKAGFIVLVFDYRFLGASGGMPRQRVIPSEQQADYRNAITYMSRQPEVDADRIGLWGTSYSGGHVLEVAATDRRVKAVVAQVPAVNTAALAWRWIRNGWHREVWQTTKLMLKQLFHPFTQLYIPVVNDPGLAATLPGGEGARWFERERKNAPSWKNEVTVSSSIAAMFYRGARFIHRIAPTPLLMVVASHDDIVLTSECLKAFQRAQEPKKLLEVEGGHFDFYEEPGLSKVLSTEVEWFQLYLGKG
jgi:fermentation-respiration switch protein FrsA (DUF1100 family)